MSVSELGPSRETPAPSAAQRRHLYLYALPFLLLPLILFTAAFYIIPSRWFAARAGNNYLANMAYASTIHDSRCQAIIYGDSTAMTGVNPALIERRTGLRTCNLAEYKGVTVVLGTRLLDRYLATNAPPKVLIFLFAPEHLSQPSSWGGYAFEAITLLVQTQPGSTTANLLARHPLDAFSWAEQGMRTALIHSRTHPIPDSATHVREATAGQLPIAGPVETGCRPDPINEYADPAWVIALRARYTPRVPLVLIDATPSPTCDASLSYNRSVLSPIVDDVPYPAYPVSAYVHGTGHMNADGATMLSNMLADQILAHRATQHP